MPKFIDLSGQTFNRLTVIKRDPINGKRVKWECVCSCGNYVSIASSKLISGHTQSCGCLQRERSSVANLKHGQTSYPNGGRPTKEYNTWAMMLRRCNTVGSVDYGSYGGRGITVCERWHRFELFYADMGNAPSQYHSIDRVDNNGPYSPDNCKWATPREQRRNQRRIVLLEHAGHKRTPMEWAEITGISNKRIHARIKRGWSIERTLTTPA